jgi:hypothetical protein
MLKKTGELMITVSGEEQTRKRVFKFEIAFLISKKFSGLSTPD